MPSFKRPTAPWDDFLKKLDTSATGVTSLYCIGGFVVTQLYGMNRNTADLDVIELVPIDTAATLIPLGQLGGPLHREHLVYLHRAAVAAIPENYEDRLIEMFPGAYKNLRLMAVDPYDLVLSKLERNGARDREDVRFLARTIPLDLDLLQLRYREELRWQLGVPAREDLTLKLWLDLMRLDRQSA